MIDVDNTDREEDEENMEVASVSNEAVDFGVLFSPVFAVVGVDTSFSLDRGIDRFGAVSAWHNSRPANNQTEDRGSMIDR